jgi:tRNA G18 (ribose-2'-O)-methylase SpoU
LKYEHNIAEIFRSSEVFSVRAIYIVGTKIFGMSGSRGAIHHVPCFFFDNMQEACKDLLSQEYKIYVFDVNATQLLHESRFPPKSAFVFGNEQLGVNFANIDSDFYQTVRIIQFGKTQSLNVSHAASIACHEYVRGFLVEDV